MCVRVYSPSEQNCSLVHRFLSNRQPEEGRKEYQSNKVSFVSSSNYPPTQRHSTIKNIINNNTPTCNLALLQHNPRQPTLHLLSKSFTQ